MWLIGPLVLNTFKIIFYVCADKLNQNNNWYNNIIISSMNIKKSNNVNAFAKVQNNNKINIPKN